MNSVPGQIQSNSPECPSRQTPESGVIRKHRAGTLIRSNLAPLMGRRDAVLDAAAALIKIARELPVSQLPTLFRYLHELFSAADLNTKRISGMFNNQDTSSREERLALHIGILSKISASLDEFRELEERMLRAAALYANDPGNEFDQECTAGINRRMSDVERNLLEQLCEYFDRVQARIDRYRQYAVKNFSRNFLECYQKSYNSVISRCDSAFEQFSIKISTPNTRSFPDEKLPD